MPQLVKLPFSTVAPPVSALLALHDLTQLPLPPVVVPWHAGPRAACAVARRLGAARLGMPCADGMPGSKMERLGRRGSLEIS